MKKSVNLIKIILISLVGLGILCGAFVFIAQRIKSKNEQQPSGMEMYENKYRQLLVENDFSVITALAKEMGITINKTSDHYATVESLEIMGELVTIGYNIEGKKLISTIGNFSAIEIGADDGAEEKIGRLQQEMAWVMMFFSDLLDSEISKYIICNEEGFQIEPEDSASFQAVLDGTARLIISIRDKDGTYWEIKSSFDHEGKLYFLFGHYFDIETFKDIFAENVVS